MHRFRRVCPVLAVSLALILSAAVPAAAGSGAGAINQAFNTSARAEAMGGAGTALAWGRNTNHWANPALAALRDGVSFVTMTSHLAAGLADDIWLHDEVLMVGAYGVTLSYAGSPLRGTKVDMGRQMSTDENGDFVDYFDSYMQTRYWGVAVDAVRLGEHLLDDGRTRWSRYASVCFGRVAKSYEDRLAPDSILQDQSGGGTAEAGCSDIGLMVRATPLLVESLGERGLPGLLGLRAGGAWGSAQRNRADEFIRHIDVDQSDPFPWAYDKGWTLHAELTLSPRAAERLGLLAGVIDPVFSWTRAKYKTEPGYVWQDDASHYVYEHDTSGAFDEWGDGWEIGLLNVLYVRRGHLSAPYGDVDGDTRGWGLQFSLPRYGGASWDMAEVPQATGLPNVKRHALSFWIDAFALLGHDAR